MVVGCEGHLHVFGGVLPQMGITIVRRGPPARILARAGCFPHTGTLSPGAWSCQGLFVGTSGEVVPNVRNCDLEFRRFQKLGHLCKRIPGIFDSPRPSMGAMPLMRIVPAPMAAPDPSACQVSACLFKEGVGCYGVQGVRSGMVGWFEGGWFDLVSYEDGRPMAHARRCPLSAYGGLARPNRSLTRARPAVQYLGARRRSPGGFYPLPVFTADGGLETCAHRCPDFGSDAQERPLRSP